MQVMKDQFDDNVVISMRTNPRDPCVAHEVGVVLLRLVCLRVHQDLEADRRSSVALLRASPWALNLRRSFAAMRGADVLHRAPGNSSYLLVFGRADEIVRKELATDSTGVFRGLTARVKGNLRMSICYRVIFLAQVLILIEPARGS